MYLTISDGSGAPVVTDPEVDLASGYLVGLAVGHRFDGGLAVELEYTDRHNEINDATKHGSGGSELVASDGSIDGRALMCNLIYRLERPWRFNPYVGFGVGYAHRIQTRLERLGGGFTRGYDSDAIAAQLMLGASTSLSHGLDGTIELRAFRAFSPDTDYMRARGELKEDYQSWSLLLGLQYWF